MADHNNQNDLLIQQMVSVERVSLNLSQSVIVTTEDKLRLKLQDHLSTTEQAKDWIAPFSLLISLALAIVTADFKDFIFASATWKAIFVISAVLSAAWLAATLRKAFKARSLNTLIEEIKSETSVINGDNSDGGVGHG